MKAYEIWGICTIFEVPADGVTRCLTLPTLPAKNQSQNDLRFCYNDSVLDMCRGIVTSVLFVTPHKLTVSNCTESRPVSSALANALTLHALAVRNCMEPKPVYGAWQDRRKVQQGRDVGFHRHAPYTNSKQLRRVPAVTLALSFAL